MVDHKKTDWLASLLIPGWAQCMYYAPIAALIFFLAAVYGWVTFNAAYIAGAHIGAALHAWTLVRDHFSGRRPATPEAWTARHPPKA